MSKGPIGQNPTKDKSDPQTRALESVDADFWTFRDIPEDVKVMVAGAIKRFGRDKKFWVCESVRAGLREYAGKKAILPAILKANNR